MTPLQKDNIRKVREATESANRAFIPAVFLRHTMVGLGAFTFESRDDLYWLVVKADNALRDLKTRLAFADSQ